MVLSWEISSQILGVKGLRVASTYSMISRTVFFFFLINTFQMKKEHRPLVQDLMPLLETLAEHHPSVEVQDMANDLRIAIATHGAVWSHKVDAAAKNLGKQTDAVKVDSGSTVTRGSY